VKRVNYTPYSALLAARSRPTGLPCNKALLTNMRHNGYLLPTFTQNRRLAMQPRQHKTASFLSAHPVFTRAEFAAAFGHPAGGANVTSLLRHHLRAGNIKRVSREVFAAVPAHLPAERMVIDRFAAASKLRSDGVLGFHSALELHGIAYSEFNEVQLVSAGRTELVDLPFGACRFVTPPKALAAAGKADYLTMTMDRQGVTVRVTAVERTVVDVLHRPELAGGVEEVLKSLDLVRYLDPAKVADYVELLDNRSLASVSGWWLEKRRSAFGVNDDVLARLRARLPRSKHYALGAEPGHAMLVEPWRVLLPPQAVDAAFEGV
jgi:predicted transcriptional regulator of viral defense system